MGLLTHERRIEVLCEALDALNVTRVSEVLGLLEEVDPGLARSATGFVEETIKYMREARRVVKAELGQTVWEQRRGV